MLSIFDDYAEDLHSLLELDGEMAQFQYLIDIGRKSTEFEEDNRISQHEMDGCMATVWIIQNQKDECYYYQGDSNAAIVKGLVTIITQALSGHTQKELKEVDIHVIEKLGLGTGLTARRQVGMMAMVDHIKKLSGSKPWPHQHKKAT
jgi:cysteine desulfuration protein SufE